MKQTRICDCKKNVGQCKCKIMSFRELEKRTINWADTKEILEKATPLTQIRKTLEEVEETELAILKQQLGNTVFTTSKGNQAFVDAEIKDGFGDILVTVLIGCAMQNLDPLQCLESALDIIEKRTGKIINGQFIKD